VVKVLVGDASLAGIYGIRDQVAIRSTEEEYARFDQTAFYATIRVITTGIRSVTPATLAQWLPSRPLPETRRKT